MKIIIAPDKFKGSLTSAEACNAIAKGICMVDERIDINIFPMADGGDGFATVMQYYKQATTIKCNTVDPLHRPIKAAYQWNAADKTAIVEIAAASGLVLLHPDERNPMKASTYGTGLLIKDAIARGATKVILGVGGSATNDAGTGILSALGFLFVDADDNDIPAAGENLSLIQEIIPPAVLPAIQFDIACDVDNVLYGPGGAANVYASQKGASVEIIDWLDNGLRHFAGIILQQTKINTATIKGAGAGGGIAAGLLPFFNAELKSGTTIIIEISNMEDALPGADLIITGEGTIDEQSSQGKLISHITALANRFSIPVLAVCGSLQLDSAGIKDLGLENAHAIKNDSLSLEDNMKNAAALLTTATAAIIRDFISKQ